MEIGFQVAERAHARLLVRLADRFGGLAGRFPVLVGWVGAALVSAERPADQLYAGKRLRFEFERTVSRLVEMQSLEYLHLPHLA